jgi:hypothetical protein
MKNIFTLLATTAVIGLTAPAFAVDVSSDNKVKFEAQDNGGVEKMEVSHETNADGTNIKSETDTDVDVDSDGNVDATVKTEKVVDPEGLMNKTKVKTETKMRNGIVIEQHKERD